MTYAPERLFVEPPILEDHVELHAYFKFLRENMPVVRTETIDFEPYWLISKYEDILEVERQPELFTNTPRAIMAREAEFADLEKALGRSEFVRTLLNMDAPDHGVYRSLTQAWFNPGNLKKLKARLHDLAKEHVERLAQKGGSCDFASDIAIWYPLHVILEILGLPREHESIIMMMTQQAIAPDDIELGARAAGMTPHEAVEQFFDYWRQITIERRANPRDDLATVIANAEVDGKPIPEFEQLSYYILIGIAGHDTTSSVTAGGMLALAQNPGLLQTLKDDASLIPEFVEEALRWAAPVFHFLRTAQQDYSLRGQKIAKGDRLMLLYPSGCRDEDVFEDADSFRMDRHPNRHIAFGHGPHKCLGMHLARMEICIFFEELIPRLESVEVAGPCAWTNSLVVSGLKKFPIRYKMS